MRFYPLFLDVARRACLVVGGGAVGTRKVDTLLGCGAAVTVVSPDTTPRIDALAAEGAIALERRPYRPEDLQEKFLVIGATDDEALNRRISADAAKINLLCNIADQPALCNFILPAIVERGDLVIAVSTSGKSPAFAKRIRRDLERRFGPEYGPFLKIMGRIRDLLLAEAHQPEAHRHLFEGLIDAGLLDLLRAGRMQEVRDLLRRTLGDRFDLEAVLASAAPPAD